MERLEKMYDIISKMDFFNQRAARELWSQKPEKIQNQDIFNRHQDLCEIKEFVDDVAELMELEEQGLLHKAEIKDGTPIWYIASLDDEGPFLIKSSYIYNVTEYEVGDLEKDFWLSEEEAEKALADMRKKV